MKQPVPVFTPSLAPHEVLERLFVARHQLADDIVERIRAAATSGTRNHTLLVGPRGAGKTHLISLAYHRAASLRDSDEIAVQLSWVPEDPWATTSYPRLLDSILDHLEPPLEPDVRPTSVAEIEARLLGRSTELGPVVLFIENLDQVFDAIGVNGQQRLRHLAQARSILFVASTTALTRDLADQAAPFYSFFTTHHLAPLTVEQAAAMLREIALYQEDEAAASYLETDQAAARLRAVAHLAGGQPRIWALLAQALTVGGLEQLVQLLLTRFDDLTPYYQEQLGRLSRQQRDIVVTLVELDHPVSVKELAESTGIDQRSLAKTMLELRERGWVVETDSLLTQYLDQRRTYYELGEPLARLAFQLKTSRGTPIRLIVEFLKSWFDPTDLAAEVLSDGLTFDYVRQAVAGYETDPVLAVSRRLHALPASRAPVLDLLGQLDDACAQLLAGDAEPLLKMPTALRTAVEDRLRDELDDGTPIGLAVCALRVRFHRDALAEIGHVPQPIAEEWYDRALALVAYPDAQPTATALVVDWLGRMWRFEEAQEVLTELTRLAGADYSDTLGARSDLAFSYWSAGRSAEAVAVMEQVVADYERVLGPDDSDTLIARANLASSYRSAGRTAAAIAIEEQVVADCERSLRPGHPHTLIARANLAVSYQSAGRTAEAIAVLEQVVADCERVLGPDHASTLRARGNLAFSYWSAGRTADAIAIEEQVVADCERVLGPDHPDTLTARANLAVSYWSTGGNADAIAVLEQVVADRERVLGPDHPDTLIARANLASSYRSAGRVADGIAIEEQVVAEFERVLGPDHPDTLIARRNLAASYAATGDAAYRGPSVPST